MKHQTKSKTLYRKELSLLFPRVDYKFHRNIIRNTIDDFITDIQCELIIDDDSQEQCVGLGHYLFVNIDDCDYSFFELLDDNVALSHFVQLYDEDGNFTSNVIKRVLGDRDTDFLELISRNILIIDRLEILPAYRGLGLGNLMVKDICEHYATQCEIVALRAFPLQFENKQAKDSNNKQWQHSMQLNSLNSNKRESSIKLVACYESMGFKIIKKGRETIMAKQLIDF